MRAAIYPDRNNLAGCRSVRRNQAGFSSFEVLIAALVLGIGVLGFAALQARALDTSGVLHFRAQAAVLAADISERMRMARIDPTLTVAGALGVWANYTAIPATLPTGNDTCIVHTGSMLIPPSPLPSPPPPCWGGGAGLLRNDVLEMRFLADQLLPGGTIDVRDCNTGSALTCVFIAWQMPAGESAADCELGDGNPNCLALQVLL